MAIEIQAPMPYQQFSQVRLFLGGSIEMGAAEPWQQRVVSALADLDVVILNPRRDDFVASWKQDITDPQFCNQVDWELTALEDANIIVVYFDPDTKSPISLLELGLHIRQKGVLVCCPEGYWRKGNVDITCQKYKVPIFVDLGKLIAVLRQTIQTATTTKALAQPETQIAPDPADIMDNMDAPDLDEVRPKPSPVSDPEQSKLEFQAFLKSAQDLGESHKLATSLLAEGWFKDLKAKLGNKVIAILDKLVAKTLDKSGPDQYAKILGEFGFTIDKLPSEIQYPNVRVFSNGKNRVLVGPGGWMISQNDVKGVPINGQSTVSMETWLRGIKKELGEALNPDDEGIDPPVQLKFVRTEGNHNTWIDHFYDVLDHAKHRIASVKLRDESGDPGKALITHVGTGVRTSSQLAGIRNRLMRAHPEIQKFEFVGNAAGHPNDSKRDNPNYEAGKVAVGESKDYPAKPLPKGKKKKGK